MATASIINDILYSTHTHTHICTYNNGIGNIIHACKHADTTHCTTKAYGSRVVKEVKNFT